MNTLSVSALSKSFGRKTLLDNVDFQCSTGEILGIFGRNGCGKSTMLKLLFGTLKADSAALSINGRPITPGEVIPQGHIGYLPQDPFLPKNLKVRDIIPLYYSGDGQDRIFYSPRIEKMASTRAGNLSMGELRYFELLLVGHLPHPFLMLDEPFSMVEPLYKDLIKELLIQLKTKKGIIITDHYYNDVFSVTDRNLMLKDGQLFAVNGKKDLAAHGYLPSETE
ncbi:ATP-binding cassette domain-containing protein [Flavobacterium sp. MFBS3-15]|uniref:ABC transporter ATP-binding protein n=1 Tax=Flavobacterium sp. MFBS3-15 TaxID=2989816 RepID=UPI002236A7CF|nr:ATP-binding cassette domain-containing protein [Flavobacterium sp. MFBS3-15]MCW4470886.1 ATP-binding cassette domain-containing protein [Flavobacterium sp. MFBS3-15]